jgi:hypothetical protein
MTDPRDGAPSADDTTDAQWFRELVEPILEKLPTALSWDSICQRLADDSD